MVMLPDEEVDKIRSECSHTNGHINYRKFAREIERAVLAKAIAQQERLHKEWSELWSPIDEAVRPLTPLGEGVAAKALELINLAKAMPMPKQEPDLFIVYNGVCISGIYYDQKSAEQYRESKQKEHSLSGSIASFHIKEMYCEPQPAQAAAIPEQWREIVTDLANELESEINAKYTEGMLEYPSQKRSYAADMDTIIRARAMLSPKPE